MSEQLALLWDGTTAARFEEFHRTNSHVYRTLVTLAREWVSQTGSRKLGIGALYEVARWRLAIETGDPDYRLNNSYRAYFARLIERQEPDLAGLFETRSSAADAWIDHYMASAS